MSLPNIPLIISRATAASGATDHGALTGLTDDDHPQYLLLAGRTGATNDAIISTDADGTIYGSELAANDLILRPNNEAQAFANTGRLRLNERVVLWEDIPDLTGGITSGVLSFTAGVTLTASGANNTLNICQITPTMPFITTGGVVLNILAGIEYSPTVTVSASGGGVQVASCRAFNHNGSYTISSTGQFVTFETFRCTGNVGTGAASGLDNTTIRQYVDEFTTFTGSGVTTTLPTHNSFRSAPIFTSFTVGDVFTLSAVNHFHASTSVTATGTINVTARRGLLVDPITTGGAGTINVTTEVGVDIGTLTGATALSLRSSGSSVQMRHAGPAIFGANEAPVSTLSVGTGSLFRVAGADGDLERIKNVLYDWPAVQGAANTVLRNDGAGALTWVTTAALGIDHGGLTGLTYDDHTQYLLLAGRAGTANDALLSTSTDGTFTGSSAAAGDLIVQATTADQNGLIRLRDELRLREDFPTPAGGASNFKTACNMASAITLSNNTSRAEGYSCHPALTMTSTTGSRFTAFHFDPTATLTTGGHVVRCIDMSGTIQYDNAGSVISLFVSEGEHFATSSSFSPASLTIFDDVTNVSQRGTASGSTSTLVTLRSTPVLSTTDTATWAISSLTGYLWSPIITEAVGSSLTITTARAIVIANPTVTGSPTITSLAGIEIDALTAGSTNRSILSNGTSTSMGHAGPVRVGDVAVPTEKLEVLGNVLIDNGGTAGELRLREPSAGGSSYVSLKSPALAATVNYTLPPDDGDAGEQLTTDGSGVLTWEAAGGSASLGTHIFARFTGSQTRNNGGGAGTGAAFQDVNDGGVTLQFAVGTSQTWVFRVTLRVDAANATMDMKVQFTGPATVTAFAAGVTGDDVGVADPTHMNALSTSSGRISLAAVTNNHITIVGMIVTDETNSGNVTLQAGQNTDNAGNLIFAATSHLHAQRIA